MRQPSKKCKGVALVLLPRDPRYTASEILPPSVTDHAPVLVKCLRSCFAETTVHGWRSCSIPREREQADFPRLAPLWWNLAVGFCQALSGDSRTPEGLGAWENPTGGLHSNRASRGKPRFKDPHPCFSLLLNHYYLQKAVEPAKNSWVILRYPFFQPAIQLISGGP